MKNFTARSGKSPSIPPFSKGEVRCVHELPLFEKEGTGENFC